MTQSLTQNSTAKLQACLSLVKDPAQHSDANQIFDQLKQGMVANAETADVLEALWNELLSARRAAARWQQVSHFEKEITDKLAAENVQLKLNNLRLMQEM